MNRFNPYGYNGFRGGGGNSIFSNRGYGSQGSFQNPRTSVSKQDAKKCSVHGKRRTIKNLEKNDEGKWVCCTGSECKTVTEAKKSETDNGESAKCVLHGKTRTLSNLGKDQNGDWVCLGSSLCKTNSNENSFQPGSYGMYQGPQYGGRMPMNNNFGGGPFCAFHGKKRTMQNLTRNQMGDWVCIPGSRCKMMAGEQLLNGTQIMICSVHGKQRSMANMEKDEDGEWVCTEDNKCKVEQQRSKGAGEQMCSTHNKSRSIPNLKQNDAGDWVCIRGSQCK